MGGLTTEGLEGTIQLIQKEREECKWLFFFSHKRKKELFVFFCCFRHCEESYEVGRRGNLMIRATDEKIHKYIEHTYRRRRLIIYHHNLI